MGAYETRLVYPMEDELPAGALSQALENQRRALLDAMLGEIKPNRKYIVELRQENYEDPPNYLAGYKAAIFVEECDEPKRGEWKNYKDEHCCSNCGEVVIDDWYDTDDWYNFCPNCGAKMK